MANPILGICLHATGGFAAGSFYLPIKKIQNWSWESGWLLNGIFAWLIAPIAVSVITVPKTLSIIIEANPESLLWTYFFGVLWGIGGLSFGLAMRYLGISLGMALALGLTAAFGTLIPPLYNGDFNNLLTTQSGQLVLVGILISLIGIAVCGRAGFLRDKNKKEKTNSDFNLYKGVTVACFAGIMSACFAFGIVSGDSLAQSALKYGTDPLWQNGPIFVIILLGGLTSNFIWCFVLFIKNKSFKDFGNGEAPLKKNYLFASLAGITWYCQFMFYGMGSSLMGELDFASWTLHTIFIILFSTFWGIVTKEWSSTSLGTRLNLIVGLIILIVSTMIIGLSNQIV